MDCHTQAYHLFRESFRMPTGDRERFLVDYPGADPRVVDEALLMLRDYEGDWRTGLAAGFHPPSPLGGEREGSRCGEWQVGQPLGYGGFGGVFLASRQVVGRCQKAAIKFLQMAPEQRERFLRERQTLADLDHDGISRFIDGGTDSGEPYIVMELVEGLPITRYCDHYRLTITERLRLFLQLCEAVEYAHRQGVLHRDLKPANVLVTFTCGRVKVLDFGVAKLLGNRGSATREGVAPYTKAYASPEQITGGLPSYASDVYSLGVLLYELVTAQLPHSAQVLETPEWAQVICEHVPLPPSQAVQLGLDEDSYASRPIEETVGYRRRSTPTRLRGLLEGNLDEVVLKALRKRAADRYPRVERLQSDVERFLAGAPVSVRYSSMRERVWTYCRRHQLATLLAVCWVMLMAVLLARGLQKELEFSAETERLRVTQLALRSLLTDGYTRLRQAVPDGARYENLRRELVRMHNQTLDRAAALPSIGQLDWDYALELSRLDCAGAWLEMNRPVDALDLASASVPHVTWWTSAEPNDARWRQLAERLTAQLRECLRLLPDDTHAKEALANWEMRLATREVAR